MHNEAGYIDIGKGKLHYLKHGEGRRLLIGFHGYGNSASVFAPFKTALEKQFTFYSFDLPFHGATEWGKETFSKADLLAVVTQLIKKEGVDKISLMGYSIGGRVCLTIVEMIPDKVDKVLLLAPDGLEVNKFYFFVTRTFIGKRIFKGVLSGSGRYTKVVDWLREKKLVDDSRYKFFMQFLDSPESRQFLLTVWPAMRELIPQTRKVQRAIAQNHIKVCIFMGKYDSIIPAKLAEGFVKDLKTVQLHILEKGHRVFDHENIPGMVQCLLSA